MITYTLLLGGNEGNVDKAFDEVLVHLSAVGKVGQCSGRYTSKAWGFEAPDFLNMVVDVETTLEPMFMLDALQAIEIKVGRTSKSTDGVYHNRPIDIDILYCGDMLIDNDRLSVPHLLISQREFALRPLMDHWADMYDVRTQMTVREMFEKLSR